MLSLLALSLFGCSNSNLSNDAQQADPDRGRACANIDRGVEGDFTWSGTWGDREACGGAAHAIGGAAGTTFDLTLDFWTAPSATVTLRDWNDDVLFEQSGVEVGDRITFSMPYGGEALLEILPEATDDDGGAYGFQLDCMTNCAANWSKYPFFLQHGLGGSADTFERAVEIFEENGYRVYAGSVSKFDTSLVRGAQWMDQIETERLGGTFRGVHIIGHSMGGLDARFMASQIDPDGMIRTITTLASPHDGSPLADIALDLIDHDYTPEEQGEVMDAMAPDGDATSADGTISFGISGLTDQLYQLSRPGAAFFNSQNPDRPDVMYRSWAGVTCGFWQWGCQWDYDWEIASPILNPTLAIMNSYDAPSDGVVDVYSSMHGDFGGVLAADHFEMSGGKFWSWPSFDDDGFFAREAYRLADSEHGWSPIAEPEAYSLEYVEDNY